MLLLTLSDTFLIYLVGGIYTVIRSKAATTVDAVGDFYCMMGIYNDKQCTMEVEMMEPESESMKGTLQAMRGKGVKV